MFLDFCKCVIFCLTLQFEKPRIATSQGEGHDEVDTGGQQQQQEVMSVKEEINGQQEEKVRACPAHCPPVNHHASHF